MTIRNATQNPATSTAPSPALLFDTINSYQKTAAIRAAIDLDVFTPLAEKPASAETIASHCHASPRGIRILCDFLAMLGFLTKNGSEYTITPDSAVFLNRRSPAYAGGTLEFLLSSDIRGAFECFGESVRKGTTAYSQHGTMAPDHPVWLSFARTMGPLMFPAAAALADMIPVDQNRSTKVLDVSASHGVWGLAFAKKNPKTQVVAVDWAAVLEIARDNARRAGLADRFTTIPGSAFDVEFGGDFDVVLVPNFLHHFSATDCVRFLKKAHAALRPGGAIAIVEFVPNPDRISPPPAAGFSLIMLASTTDGDAYTLVEYADMLAKAGFKPPTQHSVPASINVAVVATK